MVTTMRSLANLFCAVLLALSSCTTGVLVADPDRGFEGDGERYLRLRLETVQLDVVEVKPGQFTVPGALCLRDAPRMGQAPCRALQFRLPFLAYNGKDESWPVRLSMFRLERARADAPPHTAGDTLVATEGDQTVALLAPHSGAHFDVLVHVAGLGPDDDPLHGDYRLTVQSGPGSGDLLLQKNLSVGSFNQLSQIVRFMGMATLLLVGAAAL